MANLSNSLKNVIGVILNSCNNNSFWFFSAQLYRHKKPAGLKCRQNFFHNDCFRKAIPSR